MKKFVKSVLAISCCAISVVSLSACEEKRPKPVSNVLGAPKAITTIDYSQRETPKVLSVSESAEDFAARFAEEAYKQYTGENNFSVSPLSVYMALALAAQCSAGDTQSQILSTLNVSYEMLSEGFSDYYRSIVAEYLDWGETGERNLLTGEISLTNSIWLDSHTTAKRECIDALAEKFLCYSYQTEFAANNGSANEAVRQFVKENTKGLIDQDFNLSSETVFTLINTLYLKDVWNTFGKNLSFTDKEYEFKQADGSVEKSKLLKGYYNYGRVVEEEKFKTFFTKTDNGNKIHFILPKSGYSVGDVFTEENIKKVKNIKSYNGVDHDKKERYYTRCLFPEYTASYNDRIKPIITKLGVSDLFDSKKCDFSALTDDLAFCEDIIHVTELKVDRTGIEGAAVTVIPAAGSAGPDGYTEVYEDFVIDRDFGFIISDRYGHTLFSGVVTKI